MKTVLSVSLTAILTATALWGQDLTLRVRVDEVVVPVTVKDVETGRLISGLSEEDFTVREDNALQTITQFSVSPMPLSAVVLVDSGVPENSLEAIKASIPTLVGAFAEDDEVAVFRYDNQVFQVLDFTSDREELRRGLDRLVDLNPTVQLRGGTSQMPSPVINGVPVIPAAPSPITGDKRVLHDAVYEATTALRGRPEGRRRVILLISDGRERDSQANFEDNSYAVMEADVQIFALGLNIGTFTRFSSPLGKYANMSGGDLFERNSQGMQQAIIRIGEQARNQYLLAYVSTNEAPPDRVLFRRIEVECEERRYLVVHKDGYYQVP